MLILFSEKGAEAGMFKIWIAGTIVSVILSRANRFVHLKHSGDPWTGDELQYLSYTARSGWMAGGGVKGGVVYGETDDFSYNIVENPVHIRDLQATILHLFGINHERFTFKHQGLEARLTGVEEPAHVIHPLLT